MNDIFENAETMKENEHPRFYTAESVMRGHPEAVRPYCRQRAGCLSAA